jgi:hypothetical protein
MLMFAIALIVVVLVLSGAECPGRPDLVPVPPFPDMSYPWCDRDEEGLYVHVKNQGTADAPVSYTRVEFTWSQGGGGSDTATVTTPAIAVGGTQKIGPIAIPSLCWDMDCDFTITVDINDQVDESNEINNSADGTCLG